MQHLLVATPEDQSFPLSIGLVIFSSASARLFLHQAFNGPAKLHVPSEILWRNYMGQEWQQTRTSARKRNVRLRNNDVLTVTATAGTKWRVGWGKDLPANPGWVRPSYPANAPGTAGWTARARNDVKSCACNTSSATWGHVTADDGGDGRAFSPVGRSGGGKRHQEQSAICRNKNRSHGGCSARHCVAITWRSKVSRSWLLKGLLQLCVGKETGRKRAECPKSWKPNFELNLTQDFVISSLATGCIISAM